MATNITFYNYQKNSLNSDFMRIGETFFKLNAISIIHEPTSIYTDGNYKSCFIIICDSKTYTIFAYASDKDEEEKIVLKLYKNLVKTVFPSDNKKTYI